MVIAVHIPIYLKFGQIDVPEENHREMVRQGLGQNIDSGDSAASVALAGCGLTCLLLLVWPDLCCVASVPMIFHGLVYNSSRKESLWSWPSENMTTCAFSYCSFCFLVVKCDS